MEPNKNSKIEGLIDQLESALSEEYADYMIEVQVVAVPDQRAFLLAEESSNWDESWC